MRIALIGGSGWIGSFIAPEIRRAGAEVVKLDLLPGTRGDSFPFQRVDITDPLALSAALREVAPDRLIHLAALVGEEAQENPYAAYRLNLGGSANVLEVSRQLGIERVVFASSSWVYGDAQAPLVREDTLCQPTTLYGMTKLAVEHLGKVFSEQYGLQFVALRPAHGYGPGKTSGRTEDVVMIRGALDGREVHLTGASRSYEPVYVKDTARAFAAAALAHKLTRSAFNIGIGRRVSIPEVAEIIKSHIPGALFRIDSAPNGVDVERTRVSPSPLDIRAASEELGWEPHYSPEEGYAELIEYVMNDKITST